MPTAPELAEVRRASKVRLLRLAAVGEDASPGSDKAVAGRLAGLELDRRRARDAGDGKRQRELRLEQDRLVGEVDPA